MFDLRVESGIADVVTHESAQCKTVLWFMKTCTINNCWKNGQCTLYRVNLSYNSIHEF
jgi:hypothetical protein